MQTKYFLGLLSWLTLASILSGCGGEPALPRTAAQPVELTVSAAVSLKDVLTEIQSNYAKKVSNVKLTLNLGASGSLQKQIEQGAPADIFISAAPRQMDELADKNHIVKVTRKNLVANRLVLIAPQHATVELQKFEDLTNPAVKTLGIGEPAVVPAGQYARQVLQKLGVWDRLMPKMVLAKDVRTVLTYVETGNVEAGIVYKTDAVASTKVKIVATAPEGSHQPIVYQAAVLTASRNQKAAEEFLAYMAGPEGKTVFEKYGFVMGI